MAVSLKHAFTSAVADGGDTTLVQPSNWNAEHTLTLAQGNILGRLAAAGTGAATEIPLSFDASNNVTFPGQLNLAAGTTSISPLDFASGSLLTSANAGSIEYDGKVIYGTPQGTQRGVIPGMQFYRIDTSRTIASAVGASSILGVGATVSSGTVYKFEALYALSRASVATSHTLSLLFGGTATYNNFSYMYNRVASATGFNLDVASTSGFINVATATVVAAARTTAFYDGISISGTFSCNAGGTFIPQVSFSAAPGVSTTVNPGTFVLLYPISASGANTSVGAWA